MSKSIKVIILTCYLMYTYFILLHLFYILISYSYIFSLLRLICTFKIKEYTLNIKVLILGIFNSLYKLLINVPVTFRVDHNRFEGLWDERSTIFMRHFDIVINRNFALFVGRIREGRSDRHGNTILRKVVILLRAPNLWSGALWYPLNHLSFNFIRSPFNVFPRVFLYRAFTNEWFEK